MYVLLKLRMYQCGISRICRYVCTRATSKKTQKRKGPAHAQSATHAQHQGYIPKKKWTERPSHAHGATHAQRDKEGVAAV